MSAIGVEVCDICGKRMPEGKIGNLVLQKKAKTQEGYNTLRSQRNWACCKFCMSKLIGLQTKGDIVKEDIELLIDEHCGKREKRILTKNKKSVKNVMEILQ